LESQSQVVAPSAPAALAAEHAPPVALVAGGAPHVPASSPKSPLPAPLASTTPGRLISSPRSASAPIDVRATTLASPAAARLPNPASRATATGFEPGDLIETRYRVQRLLGRGGMGAVYHCQDLVLNEPIALKVISPAWSHDPADMAERFRHEASAARRISSPQVIRIFDLGETRGGLLFISMEYFPGQTLDHLLRTRGPLQSAERSHVLREICSGLSAAHAAGVIHRDLKPQNVLIGERDAIKIIDFGLAKSAFQQGMTATGLILGTPEYMSPEQIRGCAIDTRSDIYSLGALAYHAVTGRPPFQGRSPIAVGFAHLSSDPEPPEKLCADLPPRLREVILAALAKDPERRPQTVDEFRRAL
jgi:serine/threonine-protein kinase